MQFQSKLSLFNELTVEELYKILQLRSTVFVVEQNCVYQDMDDKDFKSYHLQILSPQNELLAYARLLPANISYAEVSIGRVVSNPLFRGQGFGIKLMEKAIATCQELWPNEPIRISAQHYLLKFYQNLGFKEVGDIYLEDNIPHIEMLRTI